MSRIYYELDRVNQTFRDLEEVDEYIQEAYCEPAYKNATITSDGDEWTILYDTDYGQEKLVITAYETEDLHYEDSFLNCEYDRSR